MNNTNQLPINYELKDSYDLKQTKLNLIIQTIFIIIAAIFMSSVFIFNIEFNSEYHGLLIAGFTMTLVLIYMTLHELTHGIFISLLSKTKSTYKFRFPFLTTGTHAYFNKKSFIIICLAPSILWGIVIGVSIKFTPNNLLLSLYILLGLNFAGSAGDYLQVFLISRTSIDSLIQDDGKVTSIYTVTH